MSKPTGPRAIHLRGARQNNLKNLDLDLPLGKLVVVTGLSGSGKSSLAFDTLFAEGQRRYVETFSPYARQFLDRMDKPKVERIENIPPAIAIEQRNSVRSTRSTIGTMTELTEFAKVLWLHLSELHCRQCGRPVRKDHPQAVWEALTKDSAVSDAQVTFNVPLSAKVGLRESLDLVAKQGFQRLLVDGEAVRLEEAEARFGGKTPTVFRVVQDRLKLTEANRRRFHDACEQAYHFGKGRLSVHLGGAERKFSNRLHCAECDLDYKEPVAALFSFNHPLGACPTCNGFGRVIMIDYNLAMPDWSRTLEQGVVKPWLTGTGAESQEDLMKFCKRRKVPVDVPFVRLPKELQRWVIDGDPDYGKDPAHEWPNAWYGLKGYFRWMESKSYKMHMRVLLARYRAYIPCAVCAGRRFQPESLLYHLRDQAGKLVSLSDFYELPVARALPLVDSWLAPRRSLPASNPLRLALEEMRSRLGFLDSVGLGYLTLNRSTRTLSGGETERVNLTTCLGSRLVNTLFVLDEPSVGLHARDTDRLVRILEQLRDAGNTVLVVEHDARVIRAADHLIDLGPGHGESGGHLVYEGPGAEIINDKSSLTGQYLRGEKTFPPPRRRPVFLDPAAVDPAEWTGFLSIENASKNNLKIPRLEIPLRRFVCVTGVSGSGKTTLVKQVLLPLLAASLQPETGPATDDAEEDEAEAEDVSETPPDATLSGAELITRVILVDQSPLGRTPRSTPALSVGAFDGVREFFAKSKEARQRGLNASAFSFNSRAGQCERCRGAGFEKIEMQFLSDVFIRCPDCDGKRYRPALLEIEVAPPGPVTPGWNIARMLEATVDEAREFLGKFGPETALDSRQRLGLLQEVGLGYLRLGQPINTLSGGECQRLKLARHLADALSNGRETLRPALFMFDEPTTGLHFDDVRVLLEVFNKLVDAGHSALIIEHNLDVIHAADWVIDLGPGGGEAGGEILAQGPPEAIADCAASQTGAALRAEASASRAFGRKTPRARAKSAKVK
jgi:excinuclease ABC subunit A